MKKFNFMIVHKQIMNKEEIKEYIKEGVMVRETIDIDKILEISTKIVNALKNGKKIILMGNGGSAADAQHIAAEIVGKFEIERKALPAIVLHGNTSSLTAIANDFGYDHVFERQIEAFAQPGDVVIALSTSGNSENVIRGVIRAIEKNALVIGITGKKGGRMAKYIDDSNLIRVNSDRTPIIQETTITIGHIISKIIEESLM